MPKMIFVNLPVIDLKASAAFYTSLGFKNNPDFSDDTAACMVWSESDPRHAAHARQVAHVHQPADPACNVERGDARPVVRQPGGGRCHEQGRRRQRRDSRRQSRAGSRLYVQPQPGRSRRPRLGSDLDEAGVSLVRRARADSA